MIKRMKTENMQLGFPIDTVFLFVLSPVKKEIQNCARFLLFFSWEKFSEFAWNSTLPFLEIFPGCCTFMGIFSSSFPFF